MAAAGISPRRTPRSSASPAAAGISAPMRGPCPTPPHGARSRIPRRVGGRSQADRAGAVKPNATG